MKNTKELQKHRERFLLDSFLQTLNLPIDVTKEREAPDFLLSYQGQVVGIEVTELFVPPSGSTTLQAHESLTNRIVQRAKAEYQQRGCPPIHVSIGFVPRSDLRNANRDRLSKAIVDFLAIRPLDQGERLDWRPDDPVQLPDEIAFVHALGVPDNEFAHWVIPRAGWVHPLTDALLQASIDRKAPRIETYRSATAESWLLIVADRTNPSQLFDNGGQLDGCTLRSPFDRTYYFGYPEKAVLRLGIDIKQS
jgi:hypothetical protein